MKKESKDKTNKAPQIEVNQIKYINDNESMINVHVNTWGITKADHNYPVLKTIGLASCIGVCLYHPNSHVASLIHMSENSQDIVNKNLIELLHGMERNGMLNTPQTNTEIKAHIIGGQGFNNEKFENAIRHQLAQLKIEKILNDRRTYPGLRGTPSIAFDSSKKQLLLAPKHHS